MQSCLGHQRQQTHGLQDDRLPAGIGARYDHGVEFITKGNGNGDYFAGNQRMLRLQQAEDAGRIHHRTAAIHGRAHFSLGQCEIHLGQAFNGFLQSLRFSLDQFGQSTQDPGHFSLFHGFAALGFVVDFNHLEGLNK